MSTKTSEETKDIIRAARDEHNLTLRGMAEALNVTHSAVALWEGGKEPEQERVLLWVGDNRRWVRRMGLEIFASRHMPIIENVLQPVKAAIHA